MTNVYHLSTPQRKPQPTRRLGKYDRLQQQMLQRAAFRGLTRELIQAQAARGELNPAVLDYMIDAIGIEP